VLDTHVKNKDLKRISGARMGGEEEGMQRFGRII
jgi:hypothetical protein